MKPNVEVSWAVAAAGGFLLLHMMQFCSAMNEPRGEGRGVGDPIPGGYNQEGNFAISTTIRGSPRSKITHLGLLHRSKRDAVEFAVAGLNLLGISLSVANPIAGSVFSAIAVMISLIFPGDGDPKHIQDIIWDERSKQQKMQMLDFKNHLEEIRDHSTTNNETAQRRLLSLFDSMSKVQCSFMHTDTIRSSAAHFQSFATLHLELNLLLIVDHGGDRHWQRVLERNVDTYVKYGHFVIQKDGTNIRDLIHVVSRMRYYSRTDVQSFKWNVRDELYPSIQKWIQLLPDATQRDDLINYGSIRDGGLISLKLPRYGNPWWFSCWDFYWFKNCDNRDCPGDDNPMNPGCRGEKFRIYAIDEVEDGIIRTCSWVGIYYTYMKGKYWWLGTPRSPGSCPGVSAASMKGGSCSSEAWKIEVRGKPCGVPVTDRDVVTFANRGNDYDLGQYNAYSLTIGEILFVIFRSDVEHGKYNEGLKRCSGKY